MADPEEIVTELLVALRSVERLVAERANELRRQEGWSEVTVELELAEWQSQEGSHSRLGFWGYLDGEKAGLRSRTPGDASFIKRPSLNSRRCSAPTRSRYRTVS
jgi:hypothetical protein